MNIALIDGEKGAMFGECVLSLTSLSVPEKKTFFSRIRVSLFLLYLGSIISFGDNAL